MTPASWRPKTADIPDAAGVYMFRDSDGRVLYVGKAKSLKHRVPNYFGTDLHPRTSSMVTAASSVEWITTANEVEALQLEVTLIKQHQGRFNVRYRDDKSYPYLTISLSEQVPRVMVTRGKKRKGDLYYGPYSHAYAIRETLDLLLRVFPVRSCSAGVFKRAKAAKRPCLLYDIGRCSAPCVGHVSPEQHDALVEQFRDFMDGDHVAVLADLQARMAAASENLEFEQAARVRDQIGAVRRVIERQLMVTEKPENIDAIAFTGDELEASIQTFFVKGGRMVGRKGYIVDRVEDLDDASLLSSFIERLYSEDITIPNTVLVPLLPSDHDVLEAWLTMLRGSRVVIRVPKKGDKLRFLETVTQNAKDAFAQMRLKRSGDFDSRSRALTDLQEYLDLPEAPLRIECFDISNLGPTDVVGSMVVFEDALPKKSDYRKFKVATVDGQDDFASMQEVIRRRFARFFEVDPLEAKARFAYRPGLVVVDGGKGQLSSAIKAMADAGVVDIPIVALAKRLEEVFLPGESAPRIIPRGSEALYLLQRVRDEAHRFAVGYQRTQRVKKMTLSELDAVEGIGTVRRQALLKHFGAAKRVREATPTELAQVNGIGPEMARKIHTMLQGNQRGNEGSDR
ncbi:MAG: excinuclease ABC subunit UvrC [Actinomycetota bacterium]